MTVSYPWESRWYCDAVRAEVERFATVVRDADPSTEVPTCPAWTLADLILHTGTIHRWARAMVRDLAQRRYRKDELDLGVPDDPKEYPNWLAAGARPLAETLLAADLGTAMWAWGADKRAWFWPRRMLHETTVHRVDAELAVGAEPQVSADVAVDGVDEFLVNLPHAAYFAPSVEKLRDRTDVLAFQPTDRPTGWRITLHAEGFTWRREESAAGHGEGGADVVVRASAVDLYLLAWGRLGYQDRRRYETSGDTGVLDFWVVNSSI